MTTVKPFEAQEVDFWELLVPYRDTMTIPLPVLIAWYEPHEQDVMELIDIALEALSLAQQAARGDDALRPQWRLVAKKAATKGLIAHP